MSDEIGQLLDDLETELSDADYDSFEASMVRVPARLRSGAQAASRAGRGAEQDRVACHAQPGKNPGRSENFFQFEPYPGKGNNSWT